MPPPRILFIGTLPPHPGGTAIVHSLLLPGLIAAGFAIDAVSPGTAAELGHDAFAVRHRAIRVHRFAMPYHLSDPYSRVRGGYVERQQRQILAKLDAILRTGRPEIILVGREIYLLGIPALARSIGIPCVAIAHGVSQAILNGSYGGDDGDRILAALAEADLIIAVSKTMQRLLRRNGFHNVAAVPNGIDAEQFLPGPRPTELRLRLKLPAHSVICGHVSNLKPIKRSLDLISAARRVASANPHVHYLVIGDGGDRVALQKAVKAAGLTDRFRFVGWMDRGQLSEYFRLIDIFVMPSRSEGTPLACLEAMSIGCVPLLSDIPAHREVTAQGLAGLLFEVGDVDDLAEKILRLATDRSLRLRIGAAAIARIAKAYRWETALARYVRLLRRTMDARIRRAAVASRPRQVRRVNARVGPRAECGHTSGRGAR